MGTNWKDRTEESREAHRQKHRDQRANRTPEEREQEREYLRRYKKRVAFRDEVLAAIHVWPRPSNTEIMSRFNLNYEELQRIKANRTLPDYEPRMGETGDNRSRRTG